MKIKLDENIPAGLVKVLEELGHDTDTVLGESLKGKPDESVWGAAQSASRFLITQDLRFSDMRAFRPGTHCGLLLVRLKAPGRAALLKRIGDVFRREATETWSGCLVVASETKVRLLRPQGPQAGPRGRGG